MTLLANNGFRKQLSVCVGSNIHGRCSVRPAELLRVRVASVSPFQVKMLCLFMPAPSLCRSAHGILATIFDADFGGLEYFRCHEQWPVGRGGNVLKNSMFPRVCTWSAFFFLFVRQALRVYVWRQQRQLSTPSPKKHHDSRRGLGNVKHGFSMSKRIPNKPCVSVEDSPRRLKWSVDPPAV